MSQHATPANSLWSPLRNSVFRWLWLATLASNIGSWMHDAGAGWLITELTDSAVIVALMQTATSLPSFFLLLPSGALSDIYDRRLYLMAANIGMGLVAVTIAVLTLTHLIAAWSLLSLTLLLGAGMAMMMPSWQGIIPEVVERKDLQNAIGLNTLGMNMSRVIGALIAGVIMANISIGLVFVCNAVSFLFIIAVLWQWKRAKPVAALPPERFTSAVTTGLRYAWHSPALRATIYRSIGFYFFACVMWALLPLIARNLLEGDETTFSHLYAAISTGAIISGFLQPQLRKFMNTDQLLTAAAILFGCGISLTALLPVHALAILTLSLCGAAWITVMTCAQMSAQVALPGWVRSRGIAIFQTFFMGSLAIGPVVWGSITELTSIRTALLTAAVGIVAATLFTRRWPVSGNAGIDHTPALHWDKPRPQVPVQPEQGPVMITVRYQVDALSRVEFLREMQLLGKARRRDGSTFWQIFEEAANPGCFVETYVVETWLDHLRQHERISRHDAAIETRIRHLVLAGTTPLVSHYITPP
ncbi:MAG TPA: MFS transporter [Candidatus Acidoferrum sp.]|nr:MFS transporter [Candidatus Acidoferrum sp.]